MRKSILMCIVVIFFSFESVMADSHYECTYKVYHGFADMSDKAFYAHSPSQEEKEISQQEFIGQGMNKACSIGSINSYMEKNNRIKPTKLKWVVDHFYSFVEGKKKVSKKVTISESSPQMEVPVGISIMKRFYCSYSCNIRD